MKKFFLPFAAVAMALTITACGGQKTANANGRESVEMSGAGATFPLPFYTMSFDSYSEKSGDVVSYGGIGSGGGVRNLKDGIVDFVKTATECDFDIEHIVTAMAMQNITWSESHIVSMLRELGFTDISSYKVRKMLRKNQIPNSTHRTSAGISWRDFMENLKNAKIKGVIVQ